MPPHDGVGLREDERGTPVGPHASQRDPEQAVRRVESWPLTAGPLQRAQLLPQRQILQDDLAMPAERQCERSANDEEQGQHGAIVAGLVEKINKDDLWEGQGATRVAALFFCQRGTARCRSSNRAPRRMPASASLPSWQAYS